MRLISPRLLIRAYIGLTIAAAAVTIGAYVSEIGWTGLFAIVALPLTEPQQMWRLYSSGHWALGSFLLGHGLVSLLGAIAVHRVFRARSTTPKGEPQV